MMLVTGELRIAPEKLETARPHMRAVIEATRKEPGCILYAFGEDVMDPGLIRIVERWEDAASLSAHGKTAHIAAWREKLKEIGVLGRELMKHESRNNTSI
jgi:quinol monooxygenase YgiN